MNATRLMAKLDTLGIQLEAHGDRLRYWPRSAVTPDMVDQLKTYKVPLLAILQDDVGARDVEYIKLIRPDGGLSWIHPDYVSEDLEETASPDPCAQCGTLELWQTILGNWRCLKCDPPAHRIDQAESPRRTMTLETSSTKGRRQIDNRCFRRTESQTTNFRIGALTASL